MSDSLSSAINSAFAEIRAVYPLSLDSREATINMWKMMKKVVKEHVSSVSPTMSTSAVVSAFTEIINLYPLSLDNQSETDKMWETMMTLVSKHVTAYYHDLYPIDPLTDAMHAAYKETGLESQKDLETQTDPELVKALMSNVTKHMTLAVQADHLETRREILEMEEDLRKVKEDFRVLDLNYTATAKELASTVALLKERDAELALANAIISDTADNLLNVKAERDEAKSTITAMEQQCAELEACKDNITSWFESHQTGNTLNYIMIILMLINIMFMLKPLE